MFLPSSRDCGRDVGARAGIPGDSRVAHHLGCSALRDGFSTSAVPCSLGSYGKPCRRKSVTRVVRFGLDKRNRYSLANSPGTKAELWNGIQPYSPRQPQQSCHVRRLRKMHATDFVIRRLDDDILVEIEKARDPGRWNWRRFISESESRMRRRTSRECLPGC